MIGTLKLLAQEIGVSKHTSYAWKAKYGGMDVSPWMGDRACRHLEF
jgi:transposase